MACQAVQMWSLSNLVAAYLDLAIAYILLFASVVAYVASKFLGFLGLNLPCPCDGMFFNIHSRNICLNSLFVDFPTQKVSNVQLSIKHRFPFSDSTCPKNHDYSIIGGNNNSNSNVNGVLEIEGDASCSSVSDARKPIDMKGKGAVSYRQRGRFRKHRKASGSVGKYSSVSSYDHPLHEPYCHSSTDKGENVFTNGDDNKPSTTLETNHSSDEETHIKQSTHKELQISSLDDKTAIRLLEETLEEERTARAALYSELEKERSAAASAADEAMAMILRLQAEKAAVEMEARQYQRMIEEKSAYDAEEMNILKEILVRREMEKHFLEKQVEGYNSHFEVDSSDKSDGRQSFGSSWFDSNEDPISILHQLVESTDKKEIASVDNNSRPQECEEITPLPLGGRIQENGENLVVEKIIGTCNEAETKRANGLPPIGPSRRNSLSSVNSEMMKIDSEVIRLRERLKLVREEREKVSVSVGNRERENVQLKLLEDIARQIQEIRQLNTPGRAVRQASLPLPNSKGLSKKRRSRSVSSGFQRISQG
ncbi:hypothetical protein ACP275_07G065100 [Erythranthe tilingii]